VGSCHRFQHHVVAQCERIAMSALECVGCCQRQTNNSHPCTHGDSQRRGTMKRTACKPPDAEKHLKISLIKSLCRVLAGLALFGHCWPGAGLMIIIAEMLGIAEELV